MTRRVRGDGSACAVALCPDRAIYRGLCGKHYQTQRRNGSPTAHRRVTSVSLSLAERAWRYISRDPATGCWVWTGAIANGYGRVRNNEGREENAHRALYELLVEPIAAGLQLDHLCRNRACVNPSHMEPVTQAENVRRGDSGCNNSDKTHCDHGHEFTEENTYLRDFGSFVGRVCRRCAADASARYKQRKLEGTS